MGIAIVDAVQLAKLNRAAQEALAQRQKQLHLGSATETALLEEARRAAQNDALVPFRDSFARLHNVSLAELAAFDALPSGAIPEAQASGAIPETQVQSVRVGAAGVLGALLGGTATGAAAGAGTFAAVGAMAAASTGTAISTLSGAAATSATLAWLGGGTLAAGGGGVAVGTAVVTGVVAAPVVLVMAGFIEYKGRQQRRQQRETAEQLATAETEMVLIEERTAGVIERSREIRDVLVVLARELQDRLPPLDLLIAGNPDYATYNSSERRMVAATVGLATSLVTVLSARFVDDQGAVTDLSALVLDDARHRLTLLQPA